MQNKHHQHNRSAIARIAVVCTALLLLFGCFSPIRSGAQVRTSVNAFIQRFFAASLFLECNPFLYAQTQAVEAEPTVPSEEPQPVISVIDLTPTPVIGTNRADTASRGIYADIQQHTETAAPSVGSSISYRNETSYTPDTDALLAAAPAFSLSSGEPQVFIVHTHTSESYTPDSQYAYTPDDNHRTLNSEFNVVRIGDALEQRLLDAGIAVLHDETIHDYPSYTGSYSRSLESIKETLAANANIAVVIDIHRDAMIASDGTNLKTYASIEKDGTTLDSAQLMLVIGTDEGGLTHPDWQKNLSFAVKLQTILEKMYPDLMRPINLRSERFNQHTAPAALLLEVGSSGNTLGEALTSVDLFADGLIQLLQSYNP